MAALLRRHPGLGLGPVRLLRVECAEGDVLLRSRGDIVARIESGSVGNAARSLGPAALARPLRRGRRGVKRTGGEGHSGSVLEEVEHEAVLRDPDGAQFTVASRRQS
ncbi:hypothetical protein AB0D86_49785 [Streptomyces sp. NPDC048324]|uniref:hypothetical protein n=1 Tax=Streptomyces sp. NPDC048324 TaxID=3157205 RepID=UPI003414360E